MLTVAIIGRPNVGKSTLFNRLVGKRLAIVDDTPGVTRDRREGEARLGPLRFMVIDTAGLEDVRVGELEAAMQAQTERALAQADVALLLTDARSGVTPLDSHFADLLRRGSTPVILVANKCEGRAGNAGFMDAFALGLGEPVAISAEHGEGMGELYDALLPWAEEAGARDAEGMTEAGNETGGEAGAIAEAPLHLAMVGRPNVGKSTLVNQLLGEERLVTSSEAGTTRDSIAVAWTYRGQEIRLIDTAGLRRKARLTESLEELSVADALRAIRFAHVTVLVLDATQGLEKQDLTIARLVVEEGRAPLIAVNKWDLVDDHTAVLADLRDRLQTSLTQVQGIRFVTLSALTGRGVHRLLPAVLETYGRWNRRIATGPLNRWLRDMTDRHPPPMAKGRRIQIRYATQTKARPPTFVLFTSRPEDLPEHYLRYLAGGLRDQFGLTGIPIRLLPRKGKNPYA
ncbi:MAG: ribosome biogenesis GTPase Der [Rhodospirillales bacterium]|nr:ribosome biogenesis GTPase Der [Rhodospirillales bacterium]